MRPALMWRFPMPVVLTSTNKTEPGLNLGHIVAIAGKHALVAVPTVLRTNRNIASHGNIIDAGTVHERIGRTIDQRALSVIAIT